MRKPDPARRGARGECETWKLSVGTSAVLGLLALMLASAAPAAAQAPDDAALRARVEAAIYSASDLPADSITVQVRGGVVTLVGSLVCADCGGSSTPGGPATIQQSLGALVRAVPGVERVEFRLRYDPE